MIHARAAVASLLYILIVLSAPILAQQTTQPATTTSSSLPPNAIPPMRTPEMIAKWVGQLEAYYADLYGKPLADKNRLAKLVGVLSLARLDGPALTQVLMDAMTAKDADVLVAQLAWEALHARHASLTPVQRTTWIDTGLSLSHRGAFPAGTVAPLIAVLGERPPTVQAKQVNDLLVKIVDENDLANPTSRAALEAMGKTLAAWSDPQIIRSLINKTSRAEHALRIDAALRQLPNPPPAVTDANAAKIAW